MTQGRDKRATGTPDVTLHDPDDAIGAVAGGGSGERATGTLNTIYDLSSVLFHALEGGASYDTYIEDAEREGDRELAGFFRQVRDEDSDRADRAQQLLAERTPSAAGGRQGTATSTAEGAAGVSSRTEPIGTPPREGDVPPRRTEGATSPRPESSGDLTGTEPMAEEPPPRNVERETAIMGRSEEDLAASDDVPPEVPSRRGIPSVREEAPTPRPEPSADFPGTEPVREDVLSAMEGEVPPPPEEIPPERAGKIPTAEEVSPPRTEEVSRMEGGPSGTPPPGTGGASLDPTLSEEEMVRRQAQRERGGADEGLTDEVEDVTFDEEKRRGGVTAREDRR